MHYNPMPTAISPVCAWVKAAAWLRDAPAMSLGGLMLHIERPNALSNKEAQVVSEVDAFLRDNGKHPIATVANTIFPASLVV